MSKRAYLFDMDGVLVDNCRYHVLSWLELAKKYGGKLTKEEVIAWMGAPGRDYIARMFNPPPTLKRAEELLREKEAIYRELYRLKLVPREGLLDFLEEARKAGVVCAVTTGGPTENVDFVLDGLGIREYFACVVDSSQYERGKPAPDCYLRTSERLGVDPAHCTVFEDAVNGIEAARAANMRVIGIVGTNQAVTLEKAGANEVVNSFRELTRI